MLRRTLDTHPDVTDLGEIMHPGHKRGFYQNLTKKLSHNISDGIHTKWMDVLLDTIADLARDRPNTQRYIIDMKYNMALSFGMQMHNGALANQFTSALQEKNCKVVHLIRENKLNLIVSENLAIMTNQWGLSSQQEQKTGMVRISPTTLHGKIRGEVALDQFFREQIQGIPDTCEVIYEKLFLETGDIDPAPLGQIAHLLNIEPTFNLKPRQLKQARDLSESIRNFKQVKQAINTLVREKYLPTFYKSELAKMGDGAAHDDED